MTPLPAPGAALAAAAREAASSAAKSPRARRLHDARVAAKRLRAFWRLLIPALGRKEPRRRGRALGRAARVLSDARDAQALRALALGLAKTAKGPSQHALSALMRRLPRPASRAALAGPLDALTRELAASTGALEKAAGRAASADVRAGRARLERRLARAAARAARGGRIEDFHAARKRAKDLQYALEALGASKTETKPARDAAEKLGKARDLTRLSRLAKGALSRALARRAAELQDSALELLSGA